MREIQRKIPSSEIGNTSSTFLKLTYPEKNTVSLVRKCSNYLTSVSEKKHYLGAGLVSKYSNYLTSVRAKISLLTFDRIKQVSSLPIAGG